MHTSIQPDSFLVVYADEESEEGPLHANFRLDRNGEEIALLHILAGDTVVIDHVIFDFQYGNVSQGRYPDGSGDFEFMVNNTPWHSNEYILQNADLTDRQIQVKIYPNPVRDHLYIESDKAMTRVSFYNVSGSRLIRYPAYRQNKLYIEDIQLSPGLYFVVVELDDHTMLNGKITVE